MGFVIIILYGGFIIPVRGRKQLLIAPRGRLVRDTLFYRCENDSALIRFPMTPL